MLWKRRGGIKPYGYDWNGDRSSPDYDPTRDPWLPWLRDAVREPMMWGLFTWFLVTFGLLGLYAIGAISHDTLFAGWVGKYLVLLAGLTLAGIWSVVAWVRRTPRGERGPHCARSSSKRRAPSPGSLL